MLTMRLPGALAIKWESAALDATRVTRDPDEYVLKFRGFELLDESRSLADAGLVPNGAVIVLPRRRRPVR